MFESFRSLRRLAGVSKAKSRRRSSARLALEWLENRLAPATAITLSPASLPSGTVHVPYVQAFSAGGAVNSFYANQVIAYNPGTVADAGYVNPLVALGGLNPITGSFGGHGSPVVTDYLTPFDSAFSSSDLVEIGAGGSLILKLAETASTNGYTIGVHTGFGLVDANYPSGVNTNPATYVNLWLRQADVQVSADGTNWGDLGTITFSSPSNIDTGATTDPEGGSPGVGPAADPGKPFLGSLSTFNGLDWQGTLAALNGSAGGTWLNLSAVSDGNGHAISRVNYVKFSVPNSPSLDPNTGKPELMMVDAIVGTNTSASISASGGVGDIKLTVSNVEHAIPGLTIQRNGVNGLTMSGTPRKAGTETFTVTASDVLGDTATNDFSITIDRPVSPTLSISGASSVNEGATYTLNLSSSETAPQSISRWTINWGDGHVQKVAGDPASVTHVYATGPRNYTISATATDQTGTYKAGDKVVVTVNHVPPTLGISGASSVNEGASYALSLSATDTHRITHWTINWGDGSTQVVAGDPSSVSHVYLKAPANDVISATATDNTGTYNASDTVAVTVNFVAPSFSISGPSTVKEGATYTLTLSGSDPLPIRHWTITWGDGTPPQVVKGNPRTVTHVFARVPNQYIISASAADDQGVYLASDTVTVEVTA
jgi:hypothetical protein